MCARTTPSTAAARPRSPWQHSEAGRYMLDRLAREPIAPASALQVGPYGVRPPEQQGWVELEDGERLLLAYNLFRPDAGGA